MLSAGIIVFRETLEAAMIIGIIGAATKGIAGRLRWLSSGLGAGLAGALIVAMLTERIAEFAEGQGQEIFNACVLGLAAVMLSWHNIWMAGHGAELARDVRQAGHDIRTGTKTLSAIFIIVALAVLREGSETALFLYGLLVSGENSVASTLSGGGLGLLAGGIAGGLLYIGFTHVPTRWFFAATNTLILLLAASMASQAARFLVQADFLPSLANPAWDTSGVVDARSPFGTLLHALVGYEAAPSGMQIAFYVTTIGTVLLGMRWARSSTSISK